MGREKQEGADGRSRRRGKDGDDDSDSLDDPRKAAERDNRKESKRRRRDSDSDEPRKADKRGKDGDEDSDSLDDTRKASKRDDRKERKRRRQDSDSDESSEESEDSDEGRARKRKDKKKRHEEREEKRRLRKDEKREKRRHGEDSEDKKKRKLMKEAKKFLKKGERSKMIPVGASWDKLLPVTEDDYYIKSVEFALWLKEERDIFFSSLTTEQSHKLFKEFVEVWNEGGLSEKYYAGMEKAPRTSHNWGIAIATQVAGSSGVDPETQRMIDIAQEKLKRMKHRKDQEVVMDELVPKATGREAMMEKKAARREEKRGRDCSPEPVKERDLMGGGDDFQTRLANQRAWKEKKVAAKSNAIMEKRAEYEGRETAQMDQFKALISMAGGRITIPKRS